MAKQSYNFGGYQKVKKTCTKTSFFYICYAVAHCLLKAKHQA